MICFMSLKKLIMELFFTVVTMEGFGLTMKREEI